MQAIEIVVPGEDSATDTALCEAVKEAFKLDREHFSLVSGQNAKLLLPEGTELKAEHSIYSGDIAFLERHSPEVPSEAKAYFEELRC